MAEALAAQRAVTFARELSLFNIIAEGDCLHVIQTLTCIGPCHMLFGHIIDETKRSGRMLRSCMFQHARREGNRLAHSLAKNTVLSGDTKVWVEAVPEDVDVVFQLDLSWVWLCFFVVVLFNKISLTFFSKKISFNSFTLLKYIYL